MARGWHYTKLSLLLSALLLSFPGMRIFVSVPFFFVVCFYFALVGACRYSSDLFLSSRRRTGLATTYITGYG